MTRSLAWLTPFSTLSDVGAFSRNLVGELARTQDDTGLRTSILINAHGTPFWSELPSIPLTGTAQDLDLIANFDHLIYNIGNNHENHQHVNRLALSVPGVVIVHDLVMQHYLVWNIFEKLRRPDLYAQIVAEHCGEAGLDVIALSRVCSREFEPVYAPWDTHHATGMPLIEPFLQSAAGVVVHSSFAQRVVERTFDGPILRLQLPHDQKQPVSEDSWRAWAARSGRSEVCTLVAFGHITRNKCLDTLVRAFAGSPVLRERARLILAGMPGDTQYLAEVRGLISQAALDQIVTVELDVPMARLMELKETADAFVNLRYPNTESASGSLNEQLDTGKPVVLYPTGAYGEVDAGAAIQVERESGVGGLAAALDRLVLDCELRVSTGKRGRDWVRRVGRRQYIEALAGYLDANDALLRRRRAHTVVRRGRFGATTQAETHGEVSSGWLAGLARARRLLAALDGETDQLDPEPFHTWSPALLTRFVSLGVFGEAPASPLDTRLALLTPSVSRIALYAGVAEAFAILRLTAAPETSWSPRARAIVSLPSLRPLAWECLCALRAETFVACCHVGLLGRTGSAEELQPWINRVHSGESARHVLRDFIAGPAAARTGEQPDCLQALIDWTHDAGVVTAPEFPGLPASASVEFSTRVAACTRFLVSGWHQLEADGVWSRAARSTLGFRLPSDDRTNAPGHRRRVVITGRFPVVQETGARRLRVRHGGIVLTEIEIVNEEWFTAAAELPADVEQAANVLLEFDTGRVVNMSRDGIGTDRRDLGFCLRAVRLEQQAAPATRRSRAAAVSP